MEKVTGIGGVFFRAGDPPALQKWYEQHLGITRTPTDYDQRPWWQAAGPTVYQPFPTDTPYFDRPTQGWMINFRVADLDAMVAQLRADGIEVTVDPESYPNGRFARLHDPEGNPVELWEPKGSDKAGAVGPVRSRGAVRSGSARGRVVVQARARSRSRRGVPPLVRESERSADDLERRRYDEARAVHRPAAGRAGNRRL